MFRYIGGCRIGVDGIGVDSRRRGRRSPWVAMSRSRRRSPPRLSRHDTHVARLGAGYRRSRKRRSVRDDRNDGAGPRRRRVAPVPRDRVQRATLGLADRRDPATGHRVDSYAGESDRSRVVVGTDRRSLVRYRLSARARPVRGAGRERSGERSVAIAIDDFTDTDADDNTDTDADDNTDTDA